LPASSMPMNITLYNLPPKWANFSINTYFEAT